MISNLRSVITGVKDDSWSERKRAWKTEPQRTPAPRRQQTENSQEESKGAEAGRTMERSR